MAAVHNIEIEQGATFQMNLVWRDGNNAPIDLTGYSARMKVKHTYKDTTVLLNLVSPTDIALGGSNGTIAVTASATSTAAMPAKVCVYDLELVSPTGVVKRLVQGSAVVTPEVTT